MAYMKDLSGKTAIITGGSSGIGLAVARVLLEEGATVILLGRDRKRLERASDTMVDGTRAISADVGDPVSLASVSDELRGSKVEVDILVNSAGVVCPVPLLEQTQEELEMTLRTNLLGTMNACRAFVPLMRSPGYIANISSMAGILGLYGYTSYSASKFGIVGFSESLALELHSKGIKVGTVFPTDTETPQLKEELKRRPEQLKRMTGPGGTIKADRVARSIVNGMKKGRSRIYPTFMSWFLNMVHGPAGPVVTWYLRGRLDGRS